MLFLGFGGGNSMPGFGENAWRHRYNRVSDRDNRVRKDSGNQTEVKTKKNIWSGYWSSVSLTFWPGGPIGPASPGSPWFPYIKHTHPNTLYFTTFILKSSNSKLGALFKPAHRSVRSLQSAAAICIHIGAAQHEQRGCLRWNINHRKWWLIIIPSASPITRLFSVKQQHQPRKVW